MKYKYIKQLSIASSLVITSQAALVYNDLWTNGSGALDAAAGVSWSGAASELVANAGVDPATAPAAAGNTTSKLLEDSAGGVLTMGTSTGFGPNSNGAVGSMNIALQSGTIDLSITNTWGNLAGVYGAQAFTLDNFQGAGSSFTLTYNFDKPLAATNDGGSTGGPFLAAVTALGAGATGWNADISYGGISTSTDGINFTSGLPATGQAIGMGLNDINFAAGSASGSGTTTDGFFNGWQGINGFDLDNNGFTAATDADKVYATSVSFTISRADGMDFQGTELFRFSNNGGVYANVSNVPIPEPTTGALAVLAGLGFLARRRR